MSGGVCDRCAAPAVWFRGTEALCNDHHRLAVACQTCEHRPFDHHTSSGAHPAAPASWGVRYHGSCSVDGCNCDGYWPPVAETVHH